MALEQISINGQLYFTERGTYESPVLNGQVFVPPRLHTITVVLENATQEQSLMTAANAARVSVRLPDTMTPVTMFITIESIEKLLYPKGVVVSLQEA